ncbi:MAG: S9 family peptidase [Bacteroidales bacterium]|nr:S9 family peptidase [Bacteroidales bacterium]
MKKIICLTLLSLLGLLTIDSYTQTDITYQEPPGAITKLVKAPQTPAVAANPDGTWMVLLDRPGYPSIEELAQPEMKLAGLRINPRTNGSSRSYNYTNITFKNILNGREIKVSGLPEDPRIENISWSPDGKNIAFTLTLPQGIELWVANVENGSAKQLTEPMVNDAMGGRPYSWLDNGKTLVYKSVPDNRKEKPIEPLAPKGPVVQESTGEKAPVRTYQDLLQNPYDEDLFTYYTTAQIIKVDIESGEKTPLGEKGIYDDIMPSPDGKYLFVLKIKKPYSYIVPYYRFAQEALILNQQGNIIRQIADIPVSENIPKGFGAVREGPRRFTWRNDQPATIYWIEARDGGDPAKEAEIRDKAFYLPAPFEGEKKDGIEFTLRFGGITWGTDQVAIADEWWWEDRRSITSLFSPGNSESKKVIFDRSFEDSYKDPGNFQTAKNSYGEEVLLMDNKSNNLYLIGTGASPEGNRPFVREYNLKTGKTKELFRSEAPWYEYPYQIIDLEQKLVLTRRESSEQPPNYYLRNLKKDKLTQLTDFPHPYPELSGIEKQVVFYQRKDSVQLKGDLYLPADYKEADGPLPVIMWAYPAEFKSSDAAGQVQGSPYEFIRLGWWSPLYFLTQGYAVFDDPSMPIIGEGDEEPNDSFRDQLVMNAEAAIDKLDEMGVGDPNRVAIGGHSYGAFMTANLLAHSDLFAAGIARSGAYNRTLTPFGFQSEERTYWDAPEVYYTMSPFMHADKIDEPLLMIHGEADNNSGTFPMQSERMFAAMKGLGGNARLVMLPHESHGYRAEESILHMLWEMNEWLEKYVKNSDSSE